MRSLLVVLLLAGCLNAAPADDEGGAGADPDGGGAGAAGEGSGAGAQGPLEWTESFTFSFTMPADGVAVDGENCAASEVEDMGPLSVEATWSEPVPLRLLVAVSNGGRIVADETGPSPLSLETEALGDEHVTISLLAPEDGTAPAIEADVSTSAAVAAMPDFGMARCAF